MKCPYCNEADTKVIDSRPADDTVPFAGAVSVNAVASVLLRMKN